MKSLLDIDIDPKGIHGGTEVSKPTLTTVSDTEFICETGVMKRTHYINCEFHGCEATFVGCQFDNCVFYDSIEVKLNSCGWNKLYHGLDGGRVKQIPNMPARVLTIST